MTEEGFEIDYLPVGNGEKSGDAVALRFGNLAGPRDQQTVMVIDGGTLDSGKQLVSTIKSHYGTDIVDSVIATHSDGDHVSGLKEVLDGLIVKELVMHQPWDHISSRSLANSSTPGVVRASLDQAQTLEALAKIKGIPIVEPFAGMTGFNGRIVVLGPSREYYDELVPQFRPLSTDRNQASTALERLLHASSHTLSSIRDSVYETLHIETLDDDTKHFSAENSSSVILLLIVNNKKILFTGDADSEALTQAADYAEQQLGITLNDLHLLHVPHHGSKNNVGPTILNRIKASKAQISASSNSPKHPSQRVINALIRRGASVYSTCGSGVMHHHNSSPRLNWGSASKLQFVENFDD